MWTLTASGTDLYVGGSFVSEGGGRNIAKWAGTSGSGLGSGVNGGVNMLAVGDAELFVASDLFWGGFTTAGGKISPGLARARIGSIACRSRFAM